MASLKTLSWLLGAVFLLLELSLARVDINRFHDLFEKRALEPEPEDHECNSTSCYRYYNDRTAPYLIEGWPDIDFDTGEMYSGSVPIDESDPSRTLFFIFKPATDGPVDEGQYLSKRPRS